VSTRIVKIVASVDLMVGENNAGYESILLRIKQLMRVFRRSVMVRGAYTSALAVTDTP
jgi:hypothetical protein